MTDRVEQDLADLRDAIREENKLLHQAIKRKFDWFNTILGIVGAVLALAGVVGLIFSVLTDKKMTKLGHHLNTIGEKVQEVHTTVHSQV